MLNSSLWRLNLTHKARSMLNGTFYPFELFCFRFVHTWRCRREVEGDVRSGRIHFLERAMEIGITSVLVGIRRRQDRRGIESMMRRMSAAHCHEGRAERWSGKARNRGRRQLTWHGRYGGHIRFARLEPDHDIADSCPFA